MVYDIIRVTICEHQNATLQASLDCNRPFINNTIIVTTAEDLWTQRICMINNISCHITSKLHERGQKFNKGAATQEIQEKTAQRF